MHRTCLFLSCMLLAAAAAFLAPACGDGGGGHEDADSDLEVQPDTPTDDVRQDDGGDPPADPPQEDLTVEEIPPDGDVEPDVEPDILPDEVEEEVVGDCGDLVDAIASETTIVGSCTAVVRLGYTSMSVLGWQLVCGSYDMPVTEAKARAQAQTDTGYGASGTMANPASPEDEYVFFQAPGDFGGAAAVSARTGLSVFGGSIIWMGTGDITYPDDWRPASELGRDCPRYPTLPTAVGYRIAESSEPLSASEVSAALDVVWGTALPEGMATSGYIFDAVVLLYARTVGAFDPSTAEWIVLVNGGWLE
jgi:hypothetical protein